MLKPKILVIVGPTASGKTALSIEIAAKFSGEIISADSRQVYRGMDIGTAKPTAAERRGIPHHCIDIRNPDEEYNLADFKKDAAAAIENIARQGKLPIIVGGTGLYVSALADGWELPKAKPDVKLRARLEAELKKEGLAALFKKLIARDPEAAYIVDPKNPRRVLRALEIALSTDIPFSAARKKTDPPYDALKFGLSPPREILRDKMNQRVDEMIKSGLVGEVEGLIKKYGTKPAAFDAIGYREIIAYLDHKLTLPEATALMKKNTWAYARRQMTWFRHDRDIHWVKDKSEATSLVSGFLSP